jgi:hypothetical protein
MKNQDLQLCADLGLSDQARDWAKKRPDFIDVSIMGLTRFIQTGKTIHRPKEYLEELFGDIVIRSGRNLEEHKRAARIVIDTLAEIQREKAEIEAARRVAFEATTERWVLYVLAGDREIGLRPHPYYCAIIKAIDIALEDPGKIGFAVQLSEIHPEIARSVDRFRSNKIGPKAPACDTPPLPNSIQR